MQNLGLSHLQEGVKKDGIRSPLCAITVLGYRIVVGPILGEIIILDFFHLIDFTN